MGYPVGKIINIVGDKSSGKTFLACEIIAAAYNKFGKKLKWSYDDGESGFSFDTRNLYGIEIMPMDDTKRIKSQNVEDAYCNVREFAENISDDEYGIYVIDSLDGIGSEEADKLADERFKAHKKKTEFKQGSYKMGKAKYLSQEFFPKLSDLLEKKNVLLIIISQVRTNVDPMSFEKFTRAGGKAMDFYCHTVLWLANVNKIKKKDRAIGVTVKARATKSKTPRPYREIFFKLLFDYGLDNTATNLDFLFDFLTPTGALEKDASAAWNTGETEISIVQIKEFLQEANKEKYYRININPKLHKEEVIAWLNQEGNGRLLKKFNIKFSSKMKRDELIQYIEDNNLQNELKERTLNKWESIELSIKTNRKPKYQNH